MKKLYGILLSALMLPAGCSEVNLLHPYGYDDGIAPGQIEDVHVRNWSGAATISYTLPKDDDLAFVEAKFRGTNGEPRNVRASGYVDSLIIEGFGDTDNYDIELRTYDKFNNASAPVNVTVSPTTPVIELVYESLDYSVDFGGFTIEFTNEQKAKIGIYVLAGDSVTGELNPYDVYFTERSSGVFNVRGLPDVENDFGIYVSDHWGNKSEVKHFTATPWREDFLDKKLITLVNADKVPGDLGLDKWNSNPAAFFNDKVDNWDYGHTNWPIELPHRWTHDLGVSVKLSRIRTWQRSGDDCRWQHGAWRLFKVYGCSELPDPMDYDPENPMAGWTLIGDFESVKPSGLPQGQVNDEDIQLLKDGEEFSFDKEAEPVRYIRFEINAVHSLMKLSCMSELSLWGQIEDDSSDAN